MTKILPLSLISLVILGAAYPVNAWAGYTGFPEWVQRLQSQMNQAFHIQAKISSAREPDRIHPDEYFSSCIEGHGSLEKTPGPFEEMDTVFLADGWKPNEQYQADGHGSSSFAYEKEKYLCLISVGIDSACDDEEVGHVPSEYWFTIYCKEKDGHEAEKTQGR